MSNTMGALVVSSVLQAAVLCANLGRIGDFYEYVNLDDAGSTGVHKNIIPRRVQTLVRNRKGGVLI